MAVTKTVFSSNASSIHGPQCVFSTQIDGIIKLAKSDPFKDLNEFMTQLDLGDFQYLIDNFKLETFQRLAVRLQSLRTNSHPIYIRLLNYLNSCLTTLLIVEVNVSKELVVLRQEIVKLKAENSILTNVELLTEYLALLTKKTFTIFNNQKVGAAKPRLRPEFDLYIKRYGFPKNGAFDSAHMADIVNELKIKLK